LSKRDCSREEKPAQGPAQLLVSVDVSLGMHHVPQDVGVFLGHGE
jgi:hypothetical protein